MQSKAATVEAYLEELPPERRQSLLAVREVIRAHLDEEFEEGMLYGMIGFYVPHSVYPPGYHCDPTKPLGYIGLGAQKNYLSLYLMCVYGNDKFEQQFRQDWAKTGKKLDMGKSCVRFKTADDLPLEVIGKFAGKFTARQWARHSEAALEGRPTKSVKKTTVKKQAANKPRGKRA
jgi:hypothetical protein